jgi:hypothetical protein
MANSAVLRFRIPPRLRRLIDAHRGEDTISAWLRDAASSRLLAEVGLSSALIDALVEHNKQIRGLGINLNQLAHAANEGRPVVVNQKMLADIHAVLRETRTLLANMKERFTE